MASSVIPKSLASDLASFIKATATAEITTQTVWTDSQRAALVAPTVSGYKFVAWIGVETIGSAYVGYIANPYNANTSAFYPKVTTNIKVVGTALYIKDV